MSNLGGLKCKSAVNANAMMKKRPKDSDHVRTDATKNAQRVNKIIVLYIQQNSIQYVTR